MRAYKVKMMGSNDYYLVTERQKLALDKIMAGKGTVVHIGPDTIRSSSIKSISQVSVDLECCPDYFAEEVKKEQANLPAEQAPAYKKLPTRWVVVSKEMRLLSVHASRHDCRQIAETLGENSKFYLAKCHYSIGTTGEEEYIISLNQMPEALEVVLCQDQADAMLITRRFVYGAPQF